MIRLAVMLTLLTAITAGAWTQDVLMGGAYARRGASGAPYVPTAATNLVFRWSFNSGDTNNTPDESGNGNYAYNGDGNGPTIASGYASFSGSNYVRTVSTNLLNGSNEFTATCWIWIDSFVTYSFLFSSYAATKYCGIEFDTTASRKIYCLYALSGGAVLSSVAVPTGQWAFVSAYGEFGGTKGVFIDGVSTNKSTGSATAITVIAPWCVGSHPAYTARGFVGKMDECRLYNRKLSTNEINTVMSEGRP